jgi:hypothetical protein
VEVRGKSNDAAFTNTFLKSEAEHLDGGYEYRTVQRGMDFLQMWDTPTLNVSINDRPTFDKNGQITFPPPNAIQVGAYEQWRNQFNRVKGSYEMDFTTELRRTVAFNAGAFQKAIVPIMENVPVAGLDIIGRTMLEALAPLHVAIEAASELVGQYTWGYRVSSNPFALTATPPQWTRFK